MSFLDSDSENLILGTSSSKNIEFNYFIEMMAGSVKYPDALELVKINKQKSYCEYIFKYNKKDKIVILLAGGMPLNLYREDIDSLTFNVIDVVFSEVFMLARYIAKNDLKILGRDKELENEITEDEILINWFKLYGYCSKLENFNLSDILEKDPL